VSKKFGCGLLDDVWNGFHVKSAVHVGSGGMSQKHYVGFSKESFSKFSE